jgi:site-specific DNA recombinase
MSQSFFLYVRKSTDVEDKQVLSIEAQIAELKEFAMREGLLLADIFVEKQSAKKPGRPIFNQMLERLEKGEAQGIVSWHPDRLARNSVDGGKIIYLLDCNRIETLKFPTFWFESTPQGKFMLNIAFGQSKYYVDSLSENTKRGLRQKVRRGEFPGRAILGYINDVKLKRVVVDKKRKDIVREAFELYAQGDSRLEDISSFFQERGITSRYGKPLKRDTIARILSSSFYVGLFKYNKEIYEGKHEPIVSKNIFDKVQMVLKQRGKPQKTKNEPQALCGLLSCATCGMSITGERKIKRQLNGNVHTYLYYRCTKKSKAVVCDEPHVVERDLTKEVSSALRPYILPKDWAVDLIHRLEKDAKEKTQSSSIVVQEMQTSLERLKTKLQRLLDSFLDQDIERSVYLENKAQLMGDKKSLEEKIFKFEHDQNHWLEPMKNWIKEAQNMDKIVCEDDLYAKKAIAKKIFGSNLLLSDKKVVVLNHGKSPNPSESIGESLHKTQWTAVQAAHQMASKKPFSCVMEPTPGVEPGTSALRKHCSTS